MRQFRRLQRLRLRTAAQRAVPPAFMARMIAAHETHPSFGSYSDSAIIHHGACGIRHGGGCTCTPEVFLTIDGRTVEVDRDGGVKRETRQ